MDKLTPRLDQLENKVNTLENMLSKILKAEDKDGQIERLHVEVNDLKKQLQQQQKQVSANEDVVKAIKSHQGITENASFNGRVSLDPEGDIDVSTFARLNHCIKVHEQIGNCFDQKTALFTVPTDGTYLFNITMKQKGSGGLQVAVGRGGNNLYRIVTTYVKNDSTGMTWDCRSGSVTMHLSQGQQVGAHVKRVEGHASIDWCRFSGCFVSASTSGATP